MDENQDTQSDNHIDRHAELLRPSRESIQSSESTSIISKRQARSPCHWRTSFFLESEHTNTCKIDHPDIIGWDDASCAPTSKRHGKGSNISLQVPTLQALPPEDLLGPSHSITKSIPTAQLFHQALSTHSKYPHKASFPPEYQCNYCRLSGQHLKAPSV